MTPTSRIRQTWDVVVVFLLLYTLIFLPLKVSFESDTESIGLDIGVDVLFAIDIIFSFLTSYRLPDGTLIRDFDTVAINYLKSWFVLDLVATFPFYALGSSQVFQLTQLVRIPRLLKMFRLLRLMKLLRAYRLKRLFEKFEHSPKIHQGFLRLFKLAMLSLCFSHITCCLWFFVGVIGMENDTLSWITDPETKYGGLEDEDSSTQYLASFYFTISTLASVGLGDIVAHTQAEMGFAIVLILAGATLFSYATAIISSVMTDMDNHAGLFRAKMTRLLQFIRHAKLSPQLQAKLLSEMGTQWKSQSTYQVHDHLRDELPKLLLLQVSLEIHSKMIDTSPFFSLFETNSDEYPFIGELVSSLKPETLFGGEFIATVGEKPRIWGLIQTGKIVAISPLDKSMFMLNLQSGDTFGEIPILLTKKWLWSLRCVKQCVYFWLPVDTFKSILAHHHLSARRLVGYAGSRLTKLVHTKKKIRKFRQEQKLNRESVARQSLIKCPDLLKLMSPTALEHFDTIQQYIYKNENQSMAQKRWKLLKALFATKHIPQLLKEKDFDSMIESLTLNNAPRYSDADNVVSIVDKAIKARKYQRYLDELEKDVYIWKQGVTF